MMVRSIKRIANHLLSRNDALGKATRLALPKDPISQYLEGGRLPWSPGYSKFKNQVILRTLVDDTVMQRFKSGAPLPAGFGPRLDERVVEYPWALARLRPSSGRLLDAGSVLNYTWLLDLPVLRDRTVFIYSLELDALHVRPKVSYIHGDFRDPVLRDESFETIVCISTLEHVGMWPTPRPPYEVSLAKPQPKKDYLAYRAALAEFRRLLVPGGQLLLTVPCGRYEDHDWLQQFDANGIRDIIASFGGECRDLTYYRYSVEGWQVATADECRDCSFYNIVRTPEPAPDYAAAARAVACLELIRAK